MTIIRTLQHLFLGIIVVSACALHSGQAQGVNWNIQNVGLDLSWQSVAYGNGMYVAVAYNGSGNRVMTSTDGITWAIRTSAADNQWLSVTYGNGLFVAVSNTGTGNRVMTSPDGITWTSRTSAADNSWYSVTYGNGLFVAVASTGSGNRVMTSPDGITWTSRTSAADKLVFRHLRQWAVRGRVDQRNGQPRDDQPRWHQLDDTHLGSGQ